MPDAYKIGTPIAETIDFRNQFKVFNRRRLRLEKEQLMEKTIAVIE